MAKCYFLKKKVIGEHKNMFLINEISFKVFYLDISKETSVYLEH